MDVSFCEEHNQPSIDGATHCGYIYWIESRHALDMAAIEARRCRMVPAVLTLKTGGFPNDMTVGDWQGILEQAEERVALAWIEKSGQYVKVPDDAVIIPGHYWLNGKRIDDPSKALVLIPLAAIDQEDTDV